MRLWHIPFHFILLFSRLYVSSSYFPLSLTLVMQGVGSGEVCGSFLLYFQKPTPTEERRI